MQSCCGFEILFALLFIFYTAQFAGITLLRADAVESCCQVPLNFTGNVTDCFVVQSIDFQKSTLVAAFVLLCLVYAMASSYLVRERAIDDYPMCVHTLWTNLKILARPRATFVVSLLVMWMDGMSMAVSQAILHADCISDASMWSTYIQYMGLGIATVTFTVCFLIYIHLRVWKVAVQGARTRAGKTYASRKSQRKTTAAVEAMIADQAEEDIIPPDPQFTNKAQQVFSVGDEDDL